MSLFRAPGDGFALPEKAKYQLLSTKYSKISVIISGKKLFCQTELPAMIFHLQQQLPKGRAWANSP
jgi:hypothetical protein